MADQEIEEWHLVNSEPDTSDRNPTKRYVPLETNDPIVIGSITNQLLFELLSELRTIRKLIEGDNQVQ